MSLTKYENFEKSKNLYILTHSNIQYMYIKFLGTGSKYPGYTA